MTTIERIINLINAKGISAKKMLTELELSSSSITDWKKGKAKPSYGAIVKISKYFDVCEDYLLCKTNNPTISIDENMPNERFEEMKILVDLFSEMTNDEKERLIDHAQLLLRGRTQ